MKYKIDVIRLRENRITLNGWVVGKNPDSGVLYSVLDGNREPMDFKIVPTRRDDVSLIYFKKAYDREFGFDISFPYERGKNYWLVITCEGHTARVLLNETEIAKRSSVRHKRAEKLKDLCNMETVKVVLDYWKKNGFRALVRKSRHKIKGIDSDYEYAEWYEKTRPSEEELAAQRNTVFGAGAPFFSVVIPAYKTPEQYLKALLDSILNQTYGKFEVCFADGSPEGESREKILKEYAAKDKRIRYTVLNRNLGIAGNTNAALEMTKGDFVVLCDHDDLLPAHALFEFAEAILKNPECDCIYSDEDKLDMDGGSLFDPNFKPDFNIDMLCSVNYICHLFAVRREFTEQYGSFDPAYDGAQDYDFIFRMTEHARKIVHVPKVLYHWRCHMNSTASNPESKLYAFEAGGRAIRAHYQRVWPEIQIDAVKKGVDYGIYHTFFHLQEEPLISVIIPNKDHTDDLDTAIRSLITKGTYKNLEFIVVENNSAEQKTWDYYDRIVKEFPNVRIVKWGGDDPLKKPAFNYSAINNCGVKYAKGEYLLLLNNDVEIINPDSLREMMGYAMRPDVGIVGCMLLFEDDTIQNAGVVVGFGGIAGSTFVGLHADQNSYFHRSVTAQDYSAVTAACMLTKKSVYEEAGGFSEELAVAFNDIDYCLKVRKSGRLVVYNPYALFHHYESKSRGLEDTPEKVDRFNREIATFMKKWPDILNNGDPYYNPNLTLRKADFSLRDLLKEKIGEPYHIEGIEKYL
jgi:GT2 family glycosyltransferase